MRRISWLRSLAVGTLASALAACGGGGGGGGSNGTSTPPPSGGNPAPTVTLTSNSPSVTYGADITLTWSSTNAASCTASGAWSGTKTTAGSETLKPADTSNSFQLSCAGNGTSAQATATVSVQPQQGAATPTSANPVVTLGDLSVNLTGQTPVQNTSVTLQKFSSATINAQAAEDSPLLDTDLSGADTYRIVLGAAPIAAVPITLQTGTRYATTDKFPVVYYQSEPTEDGDGQFTPVASNLDAAGALTASLPPEAFVKTSAGKYEAVVKIGLAKGYDSPTEPVAAARSFDQQLEPTVNVTAATRATVPCPLATCTETSQYNPKRLIPEYSVPKKHLGTDFSAPTSLPVSGIPGSIVWAGVNVATNGCGRNITLRPPSPLVNLRYCHLASIDPDLLKDGAANGAVVAGKTLPDDNLLGMSGNTGGASGAAYAFHLHVEVYRPSQLNCKKGVCKYVFDKPESVFPLMVDTFKIKDVADRTLRKDGTYSIDIAATSIGGATLKSAVNTQNEGVPGSPTRKICLTSNNQVSITYSTEPAGKLKTGPIIDGDVAKCAPWGTPIKITASSNTPTTTIKARYSTRPDIDLTLDPLSDHVAEITLDGVGSNDTVEEFVDWSVNNVRVARVKPDDAVLRGEAIDGNGGKRYINLSAYKNPATATDASPHDVELNVDNVSIDGSTQLTDGTADCLNLDIDRDFRYGTIFAPNPIAEQILPGTIYVMQSCEYVTKYSRPAGAVIIHTKTTPLSDDPTTLFATENALQIAYGTFDFWVTDQQVAVIGGFALGDKRVTGSFQFKLGACTVQNGCPLH